MKSIDRFYTPYDIAEKMISHARGDRLRYIADFAAGDGQLLRAARVRWPKRRFVATDVCRNTVSLLRRREPAWIVGRCDFLKAQSRNRCRALNEVKGKVSLVLLNPPFSCRGGSRFPVLVNGDTVHCSLALAFVLNSVPFLASGGQIAAILPAGCLQSEKDRSAWEVLGKFGRTEIVATNGHRTFSGSFARTVVVCFTMCASDDLQKKKLNPSSIPRLADVDNIIVRVHRGNVQMHSIGRAPSRQWLPLVHSTELEKSGVNLSRHRVDARYSSIYSPAVLLPRVGQPNRSKILLYSDRHRIVLSDCVIALQCRTVSEARKVRSALQRNWSTMEQNYGGTCAKYITINALSQLLCSLGFQVTGDGGLDDF